MIMRNSFAQMSEKHRGVIADLNSRVCMKSMMIIATSAGGEASFDAEDISLIALIALKQIELCMNGEGMYERLRDKVDAMTTTSTELITTLAVECARIYESERRNDDEDRDSE